MSIPVKEMVTDNKPDPVVEVEGEEQEVCECCLEHEVEKFAMIRASGHELRNIFPKWFKGLGAKEVISHQQSESEGNVTLTILYR